MAMKIGALAFLIGGIAALIIGVGDATGLFALTGTMATVFGIVLLIAGVIVGLFNISNAESVPFVVSVVGITLIVGLVASPVVGGLDVAGILQAIAAPVITFLAPAAIIVAAAKVISSASN